MSHSSRNRRAQKKARFAQAKKARRGVSPTLLVSVFGGIAALLLVYGAVRERDNSTRAAAATLVEASGANSGTIQIPLADLSTGQAKFYEYKANQRKVRFFLIKSSDGVYRAAADACVICYREKQGYHQEGDDMVCNKCRKHFPSAYVNEVTGGCNPDAIQRVIQGDKLLIAASDLEARTELF